MNKGKAAIAGWLVSSILLASIGCASFALSGIAPSASTSGIYPLQAIDNGGFEDPIPGSFWVTTSGRGELGIPSSLVTDDRARSGSYSLKLNGQEEVSQYVPAPAGLAERTTIEGSVYLAGRDPATAELSVTDSRGNELVYVFSARPPLRQGEGAHRYIAVVISQNQWEDFSLTYGSDYRERFGESPLPRLTLTLRGEGRSGSVYFDEIRATVYFDLTSEADLREEILDEAAWAIDNTLSHAIDDIGDPSPYIVKSIDALTGETLSVHRTIGAWPVYSLILRYLRYRDEPRYLSALTAMADAVVASLNPRTGLPRYYDGEEDAYLDGDVIPAASIDFLLAVYELTGDEGYLWAARRMGEAILRFSPRLRAVREDIEIPPGYIPYRFDSASGDPTPVESTYELHIRWFSSPGALIHLYSATGDERFHDLALAAAASYIDHDALIHYWGEDYYLRPFSFNPEWYDWDRIDPAFDDYFGYGIGGSEGPYALLYIYGRTGEGDLLPFIDPSLAAMGEVWYESIHRGGYTFADDARGWQAFYETYAADPVKYASHRRLLIENGRNVLRSTQYRTGGWVDARFRDWDPKYPADMASCPRNLLAALSFAYLADDRDPAWRAMITSVFEGSVDAYKRPYGYISEPEFAPDSPHPGGIEFRLFGELLSRLVPYLDGG